MIKKFEKYHELDPYGEENWNDGLNFLLKDKKNKLLFLSRNVKDEKEAVEKYRKALDDSIFTNKKFTGLTTESEIGKVFSVEIISEETIERSISHYRNKLAELYVDINIVNHNLIILSNEE